MTGMYAALARLLRLGSLVACFIVIASFAMFALDQVGGASQQQQNELAGVTPVAQATSASPASATHRQSAVRRAIDRADGQLRSPFRGVVNSSSRWLVDGVESLLALAVFGFGLGYVARFVRIRG